MKGVLCFGDSITFGRGEQPCLSWPGRLKKYFEPQEFWNCVYNLGIPGETSKGLLERFDYETRVRLASSRLDKYIIIIATGMNDSRWDGLPKNNKPRVNEEEFERNVKELINKAKGYSTGLFFIGLTPVDEKKTLPFEQTSFENERVKRFNGIIKKLCEDNEVLFLDYFDSFNDETWPSKLADGVHPNSAGYDLIFEKIKEFLEENNLLE